MTAMREGKGGTARAAGADDLLAWAEGSGRHRARGPARGDLRFVFYGRVSAEDWQGPAPSRARQREQAQAPGRGRGGNVAAFFAPGGSRAGGWGRRLRG